MLSAKPWKSEAIARLLASVFICHLLGSVAMSLTRFPNPDHPIKTWLFSALVAGCVFFCGVALYILRRSWELDRFTRPFVAMLVCLYLGLTLAALVQYFTNKPTDEIAPLRTIIAALSFQGVALFFIWRFAREHQTNWRDGFGFPANWKMALCLGTLLALAFLPVGWLLQTASLKLMAALDIKPEVQPAVRALAHTVTWLDRAAVGVAAIGLAPLAEELLFRGILYPAVKQAGFPRLALWGSSLLFAFVHWNLATFVPLLVLAIMLTLLYERTDNLLAPITAHALFNALNFAIFYSVGSKL